MTGKLITFEGGEGCGKSTQINIIYDIFKSTDLPAIKTREPGGSPGAEQIRNMLVKGEAATWDPVAETLLFYAARVDHVNTVIKPALAQGKHVLCDRFCDSTVVYQGIGKGIGEEYVLSLHRQTLGHFMPDLTIILDIDPATGLKRAGGRQNAETRFESMHFDFHQSVRAGFLAIARREPQRCAVVDASLDIQAVQAQIIATINQRLGLRLKSAAAA